MNDLELVDRIRSALNRVRDQLLVAVTYLDRDDLDGVENTIETAVGELREVAEELRAA